MKDWQQAKKEAADNEVFYKIEENKLLGWVDYRDENYLNQWLKKFATSEVKKDIHKFVD